LEVLESPSHEIQGRIEWEIQEPNPSKKDIIKMLEMFM